MTFDEVLREHRPALWRVIAVYAPPGAERDDLAQDVLLAVWQALPRFRRGSSPRTFILRIAHNRGLSHVWRRAIPSPPPCARSRLPRGARAGARRPFARRDRRDRWHHARERRGAPWPRPRSAAPFRRRGGSRMIDAEWNAWQSSWTGATGPLPDIRTRARKEVRLHRLANVAFFLLMAVALAASTQTFTDRSGA